MQLRDLFIPAFIFAAAYACFWIPALLPIGG